MLHIYTFVFLLFLAVSDAIKAVGDKCHSVKLVYPFSHYGLFLPPSENTGGVWLHNDDPISIYHIETRVCGVVWIVRCDDLVM